MKYTILDYFEQTVDCYPKKIAFSDVIKSISFSELRERSLQFATSILNKAPQSKVIAFYMEKSVDVIVGFLGSVYSNRPYTQINLRYPELRIQEIISTISPCVVITDRDHFGDLQGIKDCQVLLYDEMLQGYIDQETLEHNRIVMTDVQPLYINFTSGSTGKPKGVVVSHRSVIDFINCFTDIFSIVPTDQIANQAPFDFDVSVKDIYSCLFTGATVHIIPTQYFIDPVSLMDFLCEREISVLIWAVSALCFITTMNALSYRVPQNMRLIMFSGEVMPVKHLNKLRRYLPDVKYVNLYGPTEITCNCTYYVIDREYQNDDRIPIGLPFPNETVYIFDEYNQQITDKGIKGELCVAGSCLSLGYYRNPSKSAEVFVQNPNNQDYFELLYRTGDIVEYGEDGQLYYCSRKDSQIKHMGHRIELTEIEGALESVDCVDRACCFFDQMRDRIWAVYTGIQDEKSIVKNLQLILPEYMIPNRFIHIDSMPLNKNGKIDRGALIEQYH